MVCLGKIVLQFIAQYLLCIWYELHHYVSPSISWWDGSTSLKGTFRQSTRQFWDWSWNDQILAVKVEIHRGFQVSELTFFLIACLLNCFSLQGYLHFFENAEDRKLFIQHHLELPLQDEITISLGTSIQSLWWWFCKLILQSCKWMYRFQDKTDSYSLSWFFFFYLTSLFFS